MTLTNTLLPFGWQHHLLAIAALGTGNTDILWALRGIVLGALAQGLTARE
ncbi:hypothetical protein [Limnohabitans sp. Rim8]